MRILSVHNQYQQPGGEDRAVEQEVALLRAAGHEVIEYRRSNREVDALSLRQKIALPRQVVWATEAYQDIRRLIRHERPEVAHFHNTHFMVSPSAYYPCHEQGVPVVQTIHNYRLLCPEANFMRAGRVCEDCLGKRVPWPGVLHACYRHSRAQTAVVSAMLTVHRWRQTWIEQVDKYVVLTDFIRQKLVEGGIPDAKLVTKPNSIHPDPGYEDVAMTEGDYLLYVGRLSEEKGITTLLAAWRQYAGCAQDTPVLKIVGDGPLAPEVAEAAAQLPRLEWLGHQPSERVLPLMRHALGLVCPSTCYEGFPMVIVEAYAVGLPVIASEIGSLAALISPGRTGLLSRPGDASDLAANIAWLAAHGPERLQMRRGARAEFDSRYTGQRNYEALMAIYGSVVGHVA